MSRVLYPQPPACRLVPATPKSTSTLSCVLLLLSVAALCGLCFPPSLRGPQPLSSPVASLRLPDLGLPFLHSSTEAHRSEGCIFVHVSPCTPVHRFHCRPPPPAQRFLQGPGRREKKEHDAITSARAVMLEGKKVSSRI